MKKFFCYETYLVQSIVSYYHGYYMIFAGCNVWEGRKFARHFPRHPLHWQIHRCLLWHNKSFAIRQEDQMISDCSVSWKLHRRVSYLLFHVVYNIDGIQWRILYYVYLDQSVLLSHYLIIYVIKSIWDM